MSLSLSVLFMFSLFIAWFIIFTRRQVSSVMRKRITGLNDLQHLRQLLEYVPQHRGMSNALLQGDQSFKAKLDSLAEKINHEIKYMTDIVRQKDKWKIKDKLETIEQQWNFIHQNLTRLEASNSFELHSELIKKLLFLTHDIGDTSNVLLTQDNTYLKLANAALCKLPLMAEMLGQARGMGTGVAAKGQCDANMRVKLSYLMNTTRYVANEVCQDVATALENDAVLKKQADSKLQANKRSTEYFLNTLEQNIINSSEISLSSIDYYNAGTEAIQQTFALLDNITLAMKNNLQNCIKMLSRNLLIVQITVVVSLGVLVYLYFI